MLERDYAMVKNGNCDYKLTVAYDPDPDGISLDEEIQSLLSEMFNIAERSEEHTSELQSLMRISYAVFCLKKKNIIIPTNQYNIYLFIYNIYTQQRIINT